jgi:hypothetical protein
MQEALKTVHFPRVRGSGGGVKSTTSRTDRISMLPDPGALNQRPEFLGKAMVSAYIPEGDVVGWDIPCSARLLCQLNDLRIYNSDE